MKNEFDAHNALIQATESNFSGLGMLPYNNNRNTMQPRKIIEKKSIKWLTKIFNRVQ